MKKRIVAIIASVFMLMAMVPAMAFAEDAQPAAAQNYGIFAYDYEADDGSMISPERWTIDLATLEGDPWDYFYVRPYDDGTTDYTAEWTSSDPSVAKCIDTGSYEEIKIEYVSEGVATIQASIDGEVVASLEICIENTGNSNAEDEGIIDDIDDGDGDWNGIPTFAVSGNGGSLVIKDGAENFNGSTDSYYGEFRSSENVAKAVSFKIVSVEKAGTVLSGWTVYEADRVEIDSIPASVAKENGGLPPWGDPNLKHFLFDEYVEDGVEMNTFIGLWNHKIIDASMSTEELYNLGGNDKSYYAVANWTTGTVKEMAVNGQPAKLEIADDIVAVDAKLKTKYKNVEQLKNALLQEAFVSNENFIENSVKIEYMEITLKVKNKEGIWEVATPENFPEEGIEIVIPYPEGTNKEAFQFSVLHMLIHGNKAGTIETLEPELKDDGIHVVVHSLSPFAVAYQEMDKSPAMGDTANMLPWIIMAVMAAAAGALVFRRRTN